MGGATSGLTPDDIEDLTQEGVSGFTPSEIKKLYGRFRSLDRSGSGYITSEELELIPELSLNPMCRRVIGLFDPEGHDAVNFFDFVRVLWLFSARAKTEDKLKMAFKCYDIDGDGIVSENDMYEVLKDMTGRQLKQFELRIIAKEMIRENETKQPPNGTLTMEEFFDVIGEDTLLEKMTIAFGKQQY